jgi:hypothetical protein
MMATASHFDKVALLRDAVTVLDAVDVAIAFLDESRALDPAERAQLRQRGVPDSAIDRHPGHDGAPIRAASVILDEGFFDFGRKDEPEAISAYVTIARDWRGDASDIVAFAWFCGDREGVNLDWSPAAALLEGVTLAVDAVGFGQVLRQRLTRPALPIVVRNSAKAAV